MKNIQLKFAAFVIMLLVLYSFIRFDGGTIKGRIIPTDAASQVWAMSATDTLKAAISQGSFEIMNAKAGTYRIYIDATDPFKDVVKEGVRLTDGGIVDLGEIQLVK